MNFKERIEETGLKKKWIAEQIGISSVTFSYYINGTRNMPEDVERELKRILNQYTVNKNSTNGEAKIG